MVMIANFQYGWSVFVIPLHERNGWDVSAIQYSFTIFVALETWGTPFSGWITDKIGPRFGPRFVMGCGGILVAAGWIIDSYAAGLAALYVGGACAGLGAGAVYCVAVGTAVKWFSDNRGLAVGLVAGGFGAGAALTIIPIQAVIGASGYSAAFFWFGLAQGAIVLIAAQFVRHPHPHELPTGVVAKVQQSSHSFTSRQVLRSRVFWVLYVLDLLMCAGGLIATAYLAPIATSFHISNATLAFGVTALSVALVFANVMNGIARPLFGWLSDRAGLWQTMAFAFSLGALSYFLLNMTGRSPYAFIFFTGMIFFCWGEIFSLFPAMCTDLFGPKFATTNSALLYTSKGVAAFLVPLGAVAVRLTGSWSIVLMVATTINIIAVVLVIAVLRPAANRHHEFAA